MLARGRYNIYIWRGVVYGCCRRRLKANNQQSTIVDGSGRVEVVVGVLSGDSSNVYRLE